jgi:hypothetical protein
MPKGSMKKFFADRGGVDSNHDGNLVWPGTADGFPFRGQAPDFRQDEYQDIPLALDYHSQAFKLYEPEEKAKFDDIMDRIVNGWYMQHKRVDRWSDEHCGMIVWLEWVQIYGEAATSKHPGTTNNATTPSHRIEHSAATGTFGTLSANQGGNSSSGSG